MTLAGNIVGRCRGAELNCCCGATNKKSAAQLLPMPGALSLHLAKIILFCSQQIVHWSCDSSWILLTLMCLILLKLVIFLSRRSYQHARSSRLCVKRRAMEQHCSLLGANGLMAGVRASSGGGLGRLPCQDLSAHIWGVVSDASCQHLSLSQFLAPCWQCLSRRVMSVEPSCTQREVRSEHTSVQVTWFNLYLFHNNLMGWGVYLATAFFHFILGQVQCVLHANFLFHWLKISQMVSEKNWYLPL